MLSPATTGLLVLMLGSIAQSASAVDTIRVMYRWEKDSDRHGIAALHTNGTLLGASCDRALNSTGFAEMPIFVNCESNSSTGAGTITVGSKTHPLTSAPVSDDNPTCNRIFNDHMVEIDCTIPVDAQFVGITAANGTLGDCFSAEYANYDLTRGIPRLDTSLVTANASYQISNVSYTQPTNLTKRCITQQSTDVVADGNPHQNYYEKQLSGNLQCGTSSSCTVSVTPSSTWTLVFTATATLYQWINAGFSVSKSWTLGESYGCTASPGETVCVWYSAAHTAYTVQNQIAVYCDTGANKQPAGDPLVLTSVNSNGMGSNYYCVVGTCRNQFDGYWKYDGRAGGP